MSSYIGDTRRKKFKKIKNTSDKKNFINKYGHLRPGTYDILSKRYDEGKEIYFNSKKIKIIRPVAHAANMWKSCGERCTRGRPGKSLRP